MRSNPGAAREDRVEVKAACDAAQPHHAQQQTHSASCRDDERHSCAAPGVGTVIPVGDQHERCEACQLPKDNELDQIARQHCTEHRAHERHQEGEEPRDGILVGHVIACVQHDQHAHESNEQCKQPCVAVHTQVQLESELRSPAQALAYDCVRGGHAGIQADDQSRTDESDQAAQRTRRVARICGQKGRNQRAREGKQYNQAQTHDRRSIA
jgi:hypothetical protein